MGLASWVLTCVAMIAPAGPTASQSPSGAESASAPTFVVEIQGALHRGMQVRLARAIRDAQSAPGSVLIVRIDSPGGEVSLMGEMGSALERASSDHSVPTVAFVSGGPEGGAFSAGAFLALACDRIYMARGTSLGASLPVVPALIPGSSPGPGWDPAAPATYGIAAADRESAGKIVETLGARFRALAERSQREPRIAEAFVDPEFGLALVKLPDGRDAVRKLSEIDEMKQQGASVQVTKSLRTEDSGRVLALTASEAFSLSFVNGIVESEAELLSVMGREPGSVVRLAITPGEDFVQWIHTIAPILLLMGIALGILESKIAGFGIAGVLSALCFALVFFGQYLLGVADWIEALFFVVGLLLLAAEFFVAPGTVYFGVLGALCLVLSLVLSFQTFLIPRDSIDVTVLLTNLSWGGASLVGALVLAVSVSGYLPKAPLVRRAVLAPPVGTEGGATELELDRPLLGRTLVAVTDLRPSGMVEADGRRIDAVAVGAFIPRGTRVRVKDVSSNRVVVVAEGEPA